MVANTTAFSSATNSMLPHSSVRTDKTVVVVTGPLVTAIACALSSLTAASKLTLM